eukprot:TRINITY_DN91_c0_g1_i1.p1 TRINITY_DN91_c0_g1~~TRINITY_DN91_c0_g1_i1.p1  ORF type:complete len:143 (+),score=1.78 TRINITY_DN91_c0_g1_i1:87-515(+)
MIGLEFMVDNTFLVENNEPPSLIVETSSRQVRIKTHQPRAPLTVDMPSSRQEQMIEYRLPESTITPSITIVSHSLRYGLQFIRKRQCVFLDYVHTIEMDAAQLCHSVYRSSFVAKSELGDQAITDIIDNAEWSDEEKKNPVV